MHASNNTSAKSARRSRRMAREQNSVALADAGLAVQNTDADEMVPRSPAPSPPPLSKSALVLILLRREQGATLPELMAATGWLAHTTRAALTGLRKKGHAVTRGKRDGMTCYFLGDV